MIEDLDLFDALFAALADPTRRRILDVLADQGEATATTLAGHVPVSRQAVVKHLAVLAAADLVASRRQGREVRFTVRTASLAASARWLSRLATDWAQRLAVIRRMGERSG